MSVTRLRILFAGGGTAGHLNPAVNLAKAFENKWPCEIEFIGAQRGIEAQRIPKLGYTLFLLNISGFHRRLTWQNVFFPFRLLISLVKSKKELRRFNPHLVIGTGGYVMGPALKMAVKLGLPTFIQEQNSFPGVTTRLLADKVKMVFIPWLEAQEFLPQGTKIIRAGNPVAVVRVEKSREAICTQFGLDGAKKIVLVFGGSQGAATINAAVKKLLDSNTMDDNVQILWQTGRLQYEEYSIMFSAAKNKNVKLLPFIEEMWDAYKIAEFAVCRAGAMSISELAVAGLPAILVPLKSAAGNHQFRNAQSMQEKGCAELIVDDEQLAENLYEKMMQWLSADDQLAKMKKCLKEEAQPGAAQFIAEQIEKMMRADKNWPLINGDAEV